MCWSCLAGAPWPAYCEQSHQPLGRASRDGSRGLPGDRAPEEEVTRGLFPGTQGQVQTAPHTLLAREGLSGQVGSAGKAFWER